MVEYQVTLFCATNKYKPVSCLIKRAEAVDLKATKKQLINDGMIKICQKRGWVIKDLARYGYTSAKVRLYDKEKIEREAKERYEKIKEEKYASGEWKRPKKKSE